MYTLRPNTLPRNLLLHLQYASYAVLWSCLWEFRCDLPFWHMRQLWEVRKGCARPITGMHMLTAYDIHRVGTVKTLVGQSCKFQQIYFNNIVWIPQGYKEEGILYINWYFDFLFLSMHAKYWFYYFTITFLEEISF